jgi:ribosome maturation factor RimP
VEDTLLIERLEKIAKPVIEGEGLILYDIEYKRERSGWTLRFYIFRKDGYISIDDCVKISRQLNVLLDVEDLIPHSYNLEVSSPGLDRFLKRLEHFELAKGEEVKVKLKEPLEGKKIIIGKVVDVEDGSIVIEDKEQKFLINIDNVADAKIQIDYYKGVKK